MCKVETHATSASNAFGSARSWPSLEVDGSTATGSHGPGMTEIRGVDLTPSQAMGMNRHEVPFYCGSRVTHTTLGSRIGFISYRKKQTLPSTVNQSEFIVKQVPCRPDSFLKHEPNVRILWPDLKMVSRMRLTVLFCYAKTTIVAGQSKSIEGREVGRQFAPLWSALAEQLEIFFLDGDNEGAYIVPALDTRSQVISIKDRRSGLGKLVFKLLLLEASFFFLLLHLTCVFLVFLMRCCNGSSLKPARPRCDGRSFASPRLRRLAGRGVFFCGFPFRWTLHSSFSQSHGKSTTNCNEVQILLPDTSDGHEMLSSRLRRNMTLQKHMVIFRRVVFAMYYMED